MCEVCKARAPLPTNLNQLKNAVEYPRTRTVLILNMYYIGFISQEVENHVNKDIYNAEINFKKNSNLKLFLKNVFNC